MLKKSIGIKAKDGATIPAAVYNFVEPAKAVVVSCHGFGEHAGIYAELAESLARAGYTCLTFNMRGHGRLCESAEKRKRLQGIIPGYHSFLDDIESVTAYIKNKAPHLPLVLYGHSMGGNIAANYLLRRGQADIACAVLESPWFGLQDELHPFIVSQIKLLAKLSPKLAVIHRLGFDNLTGEKAKAEETRRDPLYHNRISMRMFAGVKDGCAHALQNAHSLNIPILVAYARHEAIVSNDKTLEFAEKCGAAEVTEYDCRHSIHLDIKRVEYFRDVAAFLDKHTAR